MCLKDQFHKWTNKKELPIDQDHLANLSIIDKKLAQDHTDKFNFNQDDYETDAERIQDLKSILTRFDMPHDLFDKKTEHSDKSLLGSFIKHSKDPYLDIKRSQDI